MVGTPGGPLRSWSAALLQRWGFAEADAVFIADTLVDANYRGIDSHGVIRLPAYHRRVETGLVDPAASPRVSTDRSVVQVDAAGSAGQLAARSAMEAVAAQARAQGVATALVKGSAHFGAAGYYARALAREGFVAFVLSNSEPVVVPFGGRDALLGTNPFAFAAPGPEAPISLDMATSTTAMGKVMVAKAAGTSIPADWGVDEAGVATTDPIRVAALLPAAGPKGYGLAFLIEVLCGALAGAGIGGEIGNMYTDFSKPQNVGHWMLAVDVSAVRPVAEFISRVGDLADMAHATAPAPGFDAVLVPGEPEEHIRRKRLVAGIPLPSAVVDELAALGARYDLPFPMEGAA